MIMLVSKRKLKLILKSKLRVGQHIKPNVYEHMDRFLGANLDLLITYIIRSFNDDDKKRRIDETHVNAAVAEIYIRTKYFGWKDDDQ